jgi:sulfur relay (sulfurtransferase) complex TusBCD TusD component (DsrE family)
VKCLIIVNESPWGSTLALGAWRFARAASENGLQVVAVFFREDGVYNALDGEAADAGTPDLGAAWREYSERSGARLLLCRSSADRRMKSAPGQPFEAFSLTGMFELLQQCDRVVTF